MKAIGILASAILLFPGWGWCQSGTTAFVNVNVLPMDRERVLESHTVLVRDGLILEVAPSHRVSVAEGTRIIDGEGLFLLPGLADMHVALPSSGAADSEVRDFMFLLISQGITVARSMRGAPNQLEIKRRIGSGSLLGPTLYVGAPPLGGSNAQDAESTIDLMMAHRSAGYDLQPISGDIPLEVWEPFTEEAHSRGYTFGGTIPKTIGLRGALSSGISTVEHLDGFIQEVVSDDIRARLDRGEAVPLPAQLAAVEGRKMRAIAAHTRSSDTWIVPTLHLWENRFRTLNVDSMLALPEMRYVSAFTTDRWILEAGSENDVDPEVAETMVQVRRRILRALTMAGVGVLMGTYSPELFNVPGFSLRHELRAMQSAGLTPYEILVTGTRNVAEYARRELLELSNFGTVEEGNRADLILLRSNPFQDLEALWEPSGVMVRGRWIPREEIDENLTALAERVGG